MTNLIAEVTIALNLATNWTGHVVGTNELGYVLTNHVAEISYQSNKYSFTLTNTLSDKALWRPVDLWTVKYFTNKAWYQIEWPKWERGIAIQTNINFPLEGIIVPN